MENKKPLESLSVEDQIKYLLWVKHNQKDLNEVYVTPSVVYMGGLVWIMESKGLIGFHGNTPKDSFSYLTKEGMEHIKDYNPLE